MIDQETIAKIHDTADIVDVVGEFVNLKRSGTNYKGLCPFHDEKTPSFMVSPAKGIFKCFGCGKGGNAVNFIMEHEHYSYPEALRFLAKKYHIEIVEEAPDPEAKEKRDLKDSMFIVNNFARDYFTGILQKNAEGKAVGLSYLKERGFTEESIAKFELGYCPDGKDVFTQYALEKGYKLDLLEKTGLSIVKEQRRFDRFSGRVMFPIHNLTGKVLGFGGRTLRSDKKTAKYLNSPESEIYHKSKILYGAYYARRAMVKEGKCLLVEGYTDVISMHQKGVENVVASSGTSLTEDQIRLIRRFTPNITIVYDSDPAGIKASLRGIDLILAQNMNVRIVMMPEGEDPDSFAKNNTREAIRSYIKENEEDFIRFKMRLMQEEAKEDPVKRAEMISNIVRSVSVISDEIKRSVYIKECSSVLGVDEQTMYSEMRKKRKHHFDQEKRKVERKQYLQNKKSTAPVPGFLSEIYVEENEKAIIRILLLYGNNPLYEEKDQSTGEFVRHVSVVEFIVNEMMNDEMEFKNLLYRKIFEESTEILQHGLAFHAKHFINHEDPQISQVSVDLSVDNHELSAYWEKNGIKVPREEDKLSEIVPNLVSEYKLKVTEKGMEQSRDRLQKAYKSGDEDEVLRILDEIKQMSNAIRNISEKRGIVLRH